MTDSTVSVTGESTVTETPDQAAVSFSVVSEDDDQSVVVSELDDDSTTVLAALEEQHGLSEEVTTQRYSIDRQRSPHQEEVDEEDYRGIHAYTVTLTDTERVGDVIDTLVTNGADSLDNVEFNLSDSTYQECREEAIRGAVEDARNEARIAAEAENLVLNSVVEMNVDRTNRAPVSRSSGVALAMSAEDVSTDVKNEDVSVSATVSVEYTLTQA